MAAETKDIEHDLYEGHVSLSQVSNKIGELISK